MPPALDAAGVGRRGAHDPRHNRLLAALPDADWLRWRGKLEPYAMPLGQVLYESGVPITHAYFPTSAIASLMYVTESGASASVALVGDEGMVGVPLIMGAGSTPGRAVVHSAGAGFRMAGALLQEEFARSGAVLRILLRFTQALIAQMAQMAVCNQHHSVDQQLCRWLLLNLDRMTGDEMVVTQELIAHMLGVRREGVTEAALALQHAKLIAYRRGHITVLDREGLARRSCECRAVIQAEYDRLLSDITPMPRA
ncbi:MAG: Crp/Fnr family transcriptional regulator [Rubrivivax sp.]|nr:Crp/Fnr family transcriptional regulator [Rubrivivax sp.]